METPQADGVWRDGKFRLRLSRPIEFGEQKIEFLDLREPGTGDIIDVGNPVSFDPAANPPEIKTDDARMAAMLSRVANVPPSVIRKLAPKDFLGAEWVLVPFFMPV